MAHMVLVGQALTFWPAVVKKMADVVVMAFVSLRSMHNE